MNKGLFEIPPLELEIDDCHDILKALIYEVLYHRTLGLTQFEERECKRLEGIGYYEPCNPKITRQISKKVEEVELLMRKKKTSCEVSIKFFTTPEKNFFDKLAFFSQKKQYWQEWSIVVTLINLPAASERAYRQKLEVGVRERLFYIMEKVNGKIDYLPRSSEKDLQNYQFQITAKEHKGPVVPGFDFFPDSAEMASPYPPALNLFSQ